MCGGGTCRHLSSLATGAISVVVRSLWIRITSETRCPPLRVSVEQLGRTPGHGIRVKVRIRDRIRVEVRARIRIRIMIIMRVS